MPPKQETKPVLSLTKTPKIVISKLIGVLEEERKLNILTQLQFEKARDINFAEIKKHTEPYKILSWYNDTLHNINIDFKRIHKPLPEACKISESDINDLIEKEKPTHKKPEETLSKSPEEILQKRKKAILSSFIGNAEKNIFFNISKVKYISCR